MTTFAERYAAIDAAIEAYNADVQRACIDAETTTAALDRKRLALMAAARELGLKQRDVKGRLGTFDWTHRPPPDAPVPDATMPLDIPLAPVEPQSEPDAFDIPLELRRAPTKEGE